MILLSKETFCKALQMIREQREIDAQVSKALELVGEGYFLFGAKNLYHDCLLMVLKETMNDQYGYIEWWLYETDDYRVWTQDEKQMWDLRDPADLYDYIVNECQSDTG